MPTYDYHCQSNARTVEVKHRISESVATWGEVCARAGIELGETPADAPVEKVFTASGAVIGSRSLGSGLEPPCQTGGPCCGPGGMCGMM